MPVAPDPASDGYLLRALSDERLLEECAERLYAWRRATKELSRRRPVVVDPNDVALRGEPPDA